ncbi:hypothetical protein M8756_09510 [Lutimaribacter sp. EGI FJ00015]|uniref:Uncharacterized protein n=1 Tax=Lutimaribacter degradans TaxID=2945989 RepID=A0ACC5ZX18_9RHOB|nr:hypothetical protein [Lutimaribacter sp. EGI FJ00013]MCM2562385.1 hypothetical protein [Lutimaribacter sp. EGI FJ00013]MCO0613542.1 hypothetical protein [Lutimaribacter sp. EGI FJ00015]MCO0636514.1 hypothetical protein [Lutimaribacter sp. EGI FJ00014]
MSDLDGRLLAAHAREDRAALIGLYTEAGDSVNDFDAACFYLTHAYVFALEAGAPEAAALHGRLKAAGREE